MYKCTMGGGADGPATSTDSLLSAPAWHQYDETEEKVCWWWNCNQSSTPRALSLLSMVLRATGEKPSFLMYSARLSGEIR